MQAIVHSRYGPPDALKLNNIDQPVITDDAILVRVHAAGVGKGDWLTVQGLPYVARLRYGLPNPKHNVPGFDVAGRVEAVGPNVTQLHPGAAVFGWCDGAFVVSSSVPQEWVSEGSPFTFVTDGLESALEQAQAVAGDKDVGVGAASIVQQCIRAGLLDEIHIDLVPVLLGGGVGLFDHLGTGPIDLERTRVIEGAGVTHLTYRVIK